MFRKNLMFYIYLVIDSFINNLVFCNFFFRYHDFFSPTINSMQDLAEGVEKKKTKVLLLAVGYEYFMFYIPLQHTISNIAGSIYAITK